MESKHCGDKYQTKLTNTMYQIELTFTDRFSQTPPVVLMFLKLALDEHQLCGVPDRPNHVPYRPVWQARPDAACSSPSAPPACA